MKHVLLALLLCACAASSGTHHDGGGGNDMAVVGAGRDMASSDMALACTMPGPCDNGAGVCCVRSIGPHEMLYCDTMRCPLEHGVDTSQSPLCATVADCYKAQRHDMGTLYCCPDRTYPVRICTVTACPGTP